MSTPAASKTSFENLEVYQLAERLADQIWNVVIKWDHFAKSSLGMQMVKAADSICANIAEGSRRFNYRDNAPFIRIARGSLYETKNWLRRAYRRQLLTESEIENIRPIIEELLPRLNAYLGSIKKSAETAINN